MAELFWDRITGLLGLNDQNKKPTGVMDYQDPLDVSTVGIDTSPSTSLMGFAKRNIYPDYWPKQQAMKDRLEQKIPNVQAGDSMRESQYDRAQAFGTGLLFRNENPNTPRPVVSALGNAYESVQAMRPSKKYTQEELNSDAWRDIRDNEAAYDWWDAVQSRQPGVTFTEDQIDELGIDYSQGLLSPNVTINQPTPQWRQDWEAYKNKLTGSNPLAVENPLGVSKEMLNQMLYEGPYALGGAAWDVAGILADPYEETKPQDEGLLPTMESAAKAGRQSYERVFGKIPELSPSDFTVAMIGSMAGPGGATKPAQIASRLGEKQPTGFYSALEVAARDLPQQKGTGDQMLAMIQKQAGVKPEEVQWTGLGDFLSGKPSVTKSEIEDYLLNNRVELKEVRLGEFSPEQNAVREQAIARYEDIADISADTRAKLEEGVLSSQEARVILEPLYAERDQLRRTIESIGESMNTKFSKYTTPGGSNYRELLMTTPGIKGPTSHFDQPNILAHTRVKDYTQDGQKILHVDEVQSDWHQKGRKFGYQPSEAEIQAARKEYDKLQSYVSLRGGGYTEEEAMRLSELRSFIVHGGEKIPDAPFKKNWHELMTRRILQEAADKGYSRVTFTTGRTQADRYDLSKQVDLINYSKNADGTWDLDAVTNSGDQVDIGKGLSEDKISDYVGKEIAEKIIKSEGKRPSVRKRSPSTYEVLDSSGNREAVFSNQKDADEYLKLIEFESGGTLSGTDLKVGGEGMKGFYDNMMVKAFNKEGKKFGVKVEPYNLKTGKDGEQVWSMEIPPEMRAKKKSEGSPLFSAAPLGLLFADQEDTGENSPMRSLMDF